VVYSVLPIDHEVLSIMGRLFLFSLFTVMNNNETKRAANLAVFWSSTL